MNPTPPQSAYKILFLCTGNSVRSILAGHLLRRIELMCALPIETLGRMLPGEATRAIGRLAVMDAPGTAAQQPAVTGRAS